MAMVDDSEGDIDESKDEFDESEYGDLEKETHFTEDLVGVAESEYRNRRSEDKPRVYQHRRKRYWDRHYGRIQNARRIQKKKNIREMKEDIDDMGESYLSKLARSKRKKNSNRKSLIRLQQVEYSKDIDESVHDHKSIFGNENQYKCASNAVSAKGREHVDIKE